MASYGLIISEDPESCMRTNIRLFIDGEYRLLATVYIDNTRDHYLKLVYEPPFENKDIIRLSKYFSIHWHLFIKHLTIYSPYQFVESLQNTVYWSMLMLKKQYTILSKRTRSNIFFKIERLN